MRISKYTDQFRADAVAMCERGDRSLREVASDLGVNHWTLRDWVRQSTMERRSKSKKAAEQSALVRRARASSTTCSTSSRSPYLMVLR